MNKFQAYITMLSGVRVPVRQKHLRKMQQGARVINFKEGPHADQFHEVKNGYPCPDGIQYDGVWYDVNIETGEAFLRTCGDEPSL